MTILPLSNLLEWSPTALRAKSTLLILACPARDKPSYKWACSCLSQSWPPTFYSWLSDFNHTSLTSVLGLDLALILLRMWVFPTHSWDTLPSYIFICSLSSFRCQLRSYLLRPLKLACYPHTRHLILRPFSLFFIACITVWKISSFTFEPTYLLSVSYTPTPLQMLSFVS